MKKRLGREIWPAVFLIALPEYPVDTRYPAHIAQQGGQVDAVFHLHGEAQLVEDVVLVFVHAHIDDVGVGLADFGGDSRQDARSLLIST